MTTTDFKMGSFLFYCQFILLLLLELQREHVRAQIRGCDNNHFGYQCRFKCYCKNNETCNVMTGACPSECAENFWGSNCLLSSECYYNGDNQRYRGTKSIAGDFDYSCKQWRGYSHNYCRSFQNTSKPWCYTRIDWYYCKLRDCRCPPGLYGTNCNRECHCRNSTEVCNPNTGHCTSTCGPGWKGTLCNEECDSGTFGDNCQGECHCEEIYQCRKTDGKCLSGGCVAGYAGENCQKKCDLGTFGSGCHQKCHCVDNSKCDRTDGSCEDDLCAPGYIGHSCETKCDIGTFGSGCHQKCHCVDNSKCDKTDGSCPEGLCGAGYIGQSCQTSCPIGKFGPGCKGVCYCSDDSLCSNIDGQCADGKCKSGFEGYNCQKIFKVSIWIILVFLIPFTIFIIHLIFMCVKERKSIRKIVCGESRSGVDISGNE